MTAGNDKRLPLGCKNLVNHQAYQFSFIKNFILVKKLLCDSGGIRTPNHQSRNLIFYPVELRSLQYNHKYK